MAALRNKRGPAGAAEPAQAAQVDGGAVSLTDRQLDVLGLIARGLTDKQAAALLGLQEQTVRTHRKDLRARLGARNTAHAVRIAFDHGILR